MAQQIHEHQWYAVQTLSNKEAKVKQYLDKFVVIEEKMDEYIDEVLMPSELVTEVKSGKKFRRMRKFYPGYVFIKMRLYDEDGKLLPEPWGFVCETQGVIGFIGGQKPIPLKDKEIERIINQVKESEGKEVPKIQYEIGETVNITEGPFMSMTGTVDEIDTERGKLKVSVTIFGRSTPIELEYWQVERE